MTNLLELTIGLDLGDKMSCFEVVDQADELVEQGLVPTEETELWRLFCRFPGACLVFEVGTHSPWVQRLAEKSPLGRVITADPRQLALVSQSYKKTDRRDAYVLASAGRGVPKLLNPVHHRSARTQVDRALMTSRDQLVRTRTSLVNRVRSLVKSMGGRITGVSTEYFFRKAGQQIPEPLKPAVQPLLDVLACLHGQIAEIERQLEKMAKDRYPVTELLQTIPSVGLLTALSLVLTLEEPWRFKNTRDAGAYIGLTPRKKESGKSSPELGISKAGDGFPRKLFVQCAHHLLAQGKDCPLRRWGLERTQLGGKSSRKRIVVALARKMVVLAVAIWKSGEAFDPSRGVASCDKPVPDQAVRAALASAC